MKKKNITPVELILYANPLLDEVLSWERTPFDYVNVLTEKEKREVLKPLILIIKKYEPHHEFWSDDWFLYASAAACIVGEKELSIIIAQKIVSKRLIRHPYCYLLLWLLKNNISAPFVKQKEMSKIRNIILIFIKDFRAFARGTKTLEQCLASLQNFIVLKNKDIPRRRMHKLCIEIAFIKLQEIYNAKISH